MDEILKLAKDYSTKKHEELLPVAKCSILNKIEYIYDANWEMTSQYPYEILTYLFDGYYLLDKRPDLSSLFCWQAINHAYFVEQLRDISVSRCQDTRGVEDIVNVISSDWGKYQDVLEPYFFKIPIKSFNYISSYLLKGYAIIENGILEKFTASSYQSLLKRVPSLKSILEFSYGKAYCSIVNPIVVDAKVDMRISHVNSRKSELITKGFAEKIRNMLVGSTESFDNPDKTSTLTCSFSVEDKITIILFGLIYASRCNNFHGNVAARMNSVNANKDTFVMYTDMFLLEYIILAIYMNNKGILSDDVLDKVKNNVNLM